MKTKITSLLGAIVCLTATPGFSHRAAAQTPPIVFHAPVIVTNAAAKPRDVSYTTNRQLFTVNADGTGLTQLTSGNVDSHYSSWSPDRQHIAFMRGWGEIVIMAVNSGAVFTAAAGSYPDWSPDGTKLVFEGNDYGLHVVDVDPSNGLAGTPTLIRVGDGACFVPNWSPDGQKIAFSYNSAASGRIVKVLDLATGTEVSINALPCTSPSWTPDGSKIAFSGLLTETTTKARKTTTISYQEIFLANPDGTGITQLTSLKSISVAPTWSPDGTTMVFSSGTSGSRSLYQMPLATGAVSLLQASGDAPNWAP